MGFLPRSRRQGEYKDWGFRPVLFISLRLFILLLFIDNVYPNPLPLGSSPRSAMDRDADIPSH
jgi:hypothetical protein